MNRADRRRWRSAATLADLGELVIAWLNGEVRQTPGHLGPPCGETIPLIPALTVINRGGFITDNSQLAETREDSAWNTWVEGFAPDAVLARLREAVAGTRLVLTACRGLVCGCGYPACPRAEITGFWADRCPLAAGALRDTWWVRIEDPEPGRNDVLWPVLAAALEPGMTTGQDAPAQPDPAAQLARIRAILDALNWEFDDRQYALEAIDAIVRAGDPEVTR